MSRISLRAKVTANTLYGLILAFIVGIAFFLRTYFPYDNVFTGDWVRFKWFDSWYHMRLVENLLHHFPQRIYFDPYTRFPHGQDVFFAPFYDLLLGFFAWVIGAGSPSTGQIETLGAYFPAILGALVTIPVYFIGKELFNRKVGLFAAALFIILPGQFLLRSLLGFTDHHVAETLFSSLTMLFLILAIKSSNQKQITYNSLMTRDWARLKKPLIYAVLTGISLGLYLLSWVGGFIIVFAILLYAFIQYMVDHARGKSTDYLCIIALPVFFITILLILPFRGQYGMGETQIASLVISMLVVIALSVFSRLFTKWNIKRVYYPLAQVLLSGIAYGVLYLITPSVHDLILSQLDWLSPTGWQRTIGEMMPLSLSLAWEEFTTTFYIALISLVVIAYLVIREGASDKTLLLAWSVTILISTIGQNRFAYYFAVNVSLLTAYLSWKAVTLLGARLIPVTGEGEKATRSDKPPPGRDRAKSSKKAKRKKEKERRPGLGTLVTRYPVSRLIYSSVAAIVIFFLVFYPNIGKAIEVASQSSHPRQDWYDALVWMRDNTPDPFQDADFYYELYERPPEGEDYDYPESAYGVMSWCNYGHWITYIAHRIPNANPHQQGAEEAAGFFTEPDISKASEILDEMGSRYIIIDILIALHEMPTEPVTYGTFHGIVEWARKNLNEFLEVYYQEIEPGRYEPITLYYPEYYQSMSCRLYNFGAEKWEPQETLVISWAAKELTGSGGNRIKAKVITDRRLFYDYDDAQAFIDSNPGYLIVGVNQFDSPVPLEEMEHYKLVYNSPTKAAVWGGGTVSDVRIFEYTP
jgi:oligosaccharyl transferase (archaeosortase A-associated)